MSAAVTDLDAPAVVAAKVARVQEQIDRWALVSILLGLAFTMVNVQQFAAAGAPAWSLGWVAAWLLDPMVSILLLVVVRAEQVTARWQVRMAWQVGAAKWAAFIATYVMNTWTSWQSWTWSSIVLHSVPPIFVLMGAEVLPALREGLTEAVLKARAYAGSSTAPAPPDPARAATPCMGAATDRAPRPTSVSPTATPEAAPPAAVITHETVAVDPTAQASIDSATGRLTDHADGSDPGDREDTGDREPATPPVQEPSADLSSVDDPAGKPTAPASTLTAGAAPEGKPAADTGTSPKTRAAPVLDPAVADHAVPDHADPASAGSPEGTGDDVDARVVHLIGLLCDNPELTGPEAETALEGAGLGPVSARTARRLLGKARDALTDPSPPTSSATGDDQVRATSSAEDPTPARWSQTGTDHGRPSPLSLVRPASASPSGER